MVKLFHRKFKNNEINSTKIVNPWAGLASYEDPKSVRDSLKFYGREDESYDVSKLISRNIVVTLYGKSGIGKTSLLNAGVFPELRHENYYPISIRLGMQDCPTSEMSLQAKIISNIEEKIDHIEEVDVIDPQTEDQASDFLWNYFIRHKFLDSNGEKLVPVIVFDQFEELFNSNRDRVENLLRQLDFINDRDHLSSNLEENGTNYHYEINFRFVLAIREDDLYKLEDSIDNCFLPALKRCRYRLHGLSYKGAKDVIVMPCKNEDIFDKDNIEPIVEKIIKICRDLDNNINTLMLSLLCYVLYNDFMTQNKPIHIEDIDGYKDIIQLYYLSLVQKIPEKQRRYLEDNLVDDQGRRKIIYLADLRKNAPTAEVFTVSSAARLLNNNNGRIELIHDQLATIIHSLRNKRFEDQRTQSIIISLFSYFIVATYFIWHILLVVLHASWACTSLSNEKTYISEIYPEFIVEGFPMDKVNYMLFSQIFSNIILIFMIGYELPRQVCVYFYERLNFKYLCGIIVIIIITTIMGTNWMFGLSLNTNSLVMPIIGYIIVFGILILSNNNKASDEKK